MILATAADPFGAARRNWSQGANNKEDEHFANFSDDGKHYTHMYFGPQTAPTLTLCGVGGACNPVWKANDVIAEYGLRSPKFLELKADDGTTLYGRLLLPPDGTASGKIPLIVNIYGGPAGQTVRKGMPDAFDEILSRKGFAISSVDNRGTPGRDKKFQTAIRHEFGAIELKDQLTALDQLLPQYPQLDKDRIGIWGWSNGGSMTLYSMTHSNALPHRRGGGSGKKSGQLRSILTLWLPKDDKAGYDMSDVTKSAGNPRRIVLRMDQRYNAAFNNIPESINANFNARK